MRGDEEDECKLTTTTSRSSRRPVMVMLLASQAGDQAGGEWLDGEKELRLWRYVAAGS